MIAKSTLALLIGGGIFLSCSKEETSPEIVVPGYSEILQEYNIRPPRLDYGYPLSRNCDHIAPYRVIFLKERVSGVISYGDNIRVARPTPRSAKMIRDPEGEFVLFEDDSFETYFIVADSTISFNDLVNFIQNIPVLECAHVYLVGENFRYSPFVLRRSGYFPWNECDFSTGCGAPPQFHKRDVLNIEFNAEKVLLLDRIPLPIDSLPAFMSGYFWDNYYEDVNASVPGRSFYTLSELNEKISGLQVAMDKQTQPDLKELYRYDKERFSGLAEIAEITGDVSEFSRGAHIKFLISENNLSVTEYFHFLDAFNKGVYESRQRKALESFGANYITLIDKNKFTELQYIEWEFPYRMFHTFKR